MKKTDLRAQLIRLKAHATYILGEADAPTARAHAEGQLNAFRAVALSYGLDLE